MLYPLLIFAASVIVSGLLSTGWYKSRILGRYSAPAINTILSLILLVIVISGFNGFKNESLRHGWSLPMAEFNIGADSLSLMFIIPLLILAAACSIYGAQYFKEHRPNRSHWLYYGLLVAGMVMVLLSRNVVLFMISWEVMSFSSFLLVISDAEKETVRRAGWIYFITAHVGTAFLLAAFFMLGTEAGSFNFELFSFAALPASKSNLIFIFAFAGFGLKAGFIPFHIWLPLAHPAAPSHVSALMSGIMIKMGIYGIIRILTFVAPFQLWWGILLVVIGAVSGILGVLFAIGQHDIKRLLAYSSVENIGIVLIGLGIGISGKAFGYAQVSMFGFAGALLHIVNHALFKGLMFLGAGSVIRQTGTGELDHLGGLLKRMPETGILILIGSVAITGLPFFNGFISELFIYAGAIIAAVTSTDAVMPMVAALAVLSLALIGGLAAACFTKLFGVVFQGESRKLDVAKVKDVPPLMKSGMGILAVLIVFMGMFSFAAVPFLEKPVQILTGLSSESDNAAAVFSQLTDLSITISLILAAVLLVMAVLFFAGRFLFRRKAVTGVETWGCGYNKPAPSMQYTASSYAAPITERFTTVLALDKEVKSDNSVFPEKNWSFRSRVEDWFLSKVFIRIVKALDRILSLLRWFQCGKAGVYVLYIGCTVIILFIWKFVL